MAMMTSLVLILLLAIVSPSFGQIITSPTIVAPVTGTGVHHGPTNGGDSYPLIFTVGLTGTGSANCTASFTAPTRLLSGADIDANCNDPGLEPFTSLFCSDLQPPSNGSAPITLYSGSGVATQVCSGSQYTVTLDCGNNSPPSQTFNLTGGSSEIRVSLSDNAVNGDTANQTNVPVVDFKTNRFYNVTATVANTGCAPAIGVVCTITIPSPLHTPVSQGVVQFLPGQSQGTGGCTLLSNVFTCPSPVTDPNGGTIAVNGSSTYVVAMELTENGVLNSRISCTASRLGNQDNLVTSRTAYGIGFFVNSTSSETIHMESTSSDDLVINTIIPLSVFGGIMIFLICVGAITIVVYIFVKKVILSEESVGF